MKDTAAAAETQQPQVDQQQQARELQQQPQTQKGGTQ